MRVAFISSLLPTPNPTTGFEIANSCVVAGLEALGHDVSTYGLLLPRQTAPEEANAHVLGTADIENASATLSRKLRWLGHAMTKGLPFAASKLITAKGFASLDLSAADVIVLNSWQVQAAFPDIASGKPTIYLAHNVEWKSARENARFARSAVERILHARDARLLRRMEAQSVRTADFVWTLSQEDAQTFGLEPDHHAVLPLTLPPVRSTPSDAVAFDAALIGTWSWQPNEIGLTWFLDRVLPHLPSEIRIAIAGTTPERLKRTDPRLIWLGRVDDANAFLGQAHVVPLVARGGTGIQLKTIEVCQRGLAAVATSSSLRGLAEVPDNVIHRDDPTEFARALCETVSRSRTGETVRVDGSKFAQTQTERLHDALARGVDRATGTG